MHENLNAPVTAALQAPEKRSGNLPGGGISDDERYRQLQEDHCDGTAYGTRRETLACGLVAGACLIGMGGVEDCDRMKPERKDPKRLPSYWIEKGWCQKVGARDRRGRDVDPLGPAAQRWCALGAFGRAGRPDGFIAALNNVIGGPADRISNWNDTHRQATVLRVVRQAEKDCGLATEKGATA